MATMIIGPETSKAGHKPGPRPSLSVRVGRLLTHRKATNEFLGTTSCHHPKMYSESLSDDSLAYFSLTNFWGSSLTTETIIRKWLGRELNAQTKNDLITIAHKCQFTLKPLLQQSVTWIKSFLTIYIDTNIQTNVSVNTVLDAYLILIKKIYLSIYIYMYL